MLHPPNVAGIEADRRGARRAPAAHAKAASPRAATASLQRAVSNQAVLRLLDPQSAPPSVPRYNGSAGLTISRPDDRYEREADATAELVLARSAIGGAPDLTVAGGAEHQIHRQVSPYFEDATVMGNGGPQPEEQQTPPALQMMATQQGPNDAPPPGFESALDSSLSRGQPLEGALGDDMSSRFGADFSAVRFHLGSDAQALSDAISARAFTRGQHVFFARGEYQPETDAGRKVIAHELAHVIQQGAAPPSAAGSRGELVTAHEQVPSAAVQRLKLKSPVTVVRAGVMPWGPPDPRGDDYAVTTDAGGSVAGWSALSGYDERLRYWCHGFALGTYASDGYSVYSGPPMRQVISDEYNPVSVSSLGQGDLAVRLQEAGGPRIYDHSAVFISVVTSGGAVDENASRLDTKNGPDPFKNDTFTGVKTTYPGTYGYFRHK